MDTIGAAMAIFQFPPITPKKANFVSKFEKKKLFDFLDFGGGLKGFRVEIEKSPLWRYFYPPKVSTATAIVEVVL